LYCFVDLTKKSCACDITKKPSQTDICGDRLTRGHQIHNHHVSSQIHSSQLTFLQEINNQLEYESDFSIEFDIMLCSACNSRYERSKKTKLSPKKYLSKIQNFSKPMYKLLSKHKTILRFLENG